MNVFSLKTRADQRADLNSYELFTLEEQAAPHQMIRGFRPQVFAAAALGIIFAFIIAAVSYMNFRRDSDAAGERPFAFFEVRAIDPDGRAVAGASVLQGDLPLGITDSFGEWRRFMRVKLGENIAITIVKPLVNGKLFAVKNLAVPRNVPKEGELEVLSSVQMSRALDAKGGPAPRRDALKLGSLDLQRRTQSSDATGQR